MPKTSSRNSTSGASETFNVPLGSSANWVVGNEGGGTGALITGSELLRFLIPNGAPNPSGGTAIYNLTAALLPNALYSKLQVSARVLTATNTGVDGRIVMSLKGPTDANPDLAIIIWGNGRIETAWTDAAGAFNSFGFSATNQFPLNGNGWFRVSVEGSILTCAWADSASTPTSWRTLTSRVLTFRDIGEPQFTRVSFGGLNFGVAVADTTIEISEISVQTS